MEPCSPKRVETFDYSRLSSAFATLGKPAQRALINNKILSPKDLSNRTRKEVAGLHGIGPSSLPTLDQVLRASNLRFKKER